jgi:hypothetical protein
MANDSAAIVKEPPAPTLERNLNLRLGEAAYQRYQLIKKRLGNRPNEETVLSLVRTQEEVLAAKQRVTRSVTITIPEVLFCCMQKLQATLEAQYAVDLSTAISYGLLYYVIDSAANQTKPEVMSKLRTFLEQGPSALNHNDITRTYAQAVKLPEQETASTEPPES